MEEEDEQLQAALDQARDDARTVMHTEQGRRLVWRFIKWTGYGTDAFVPGSFEQTAYRLGRMSAGEALLNDMRTAAPEFVERMEKENGP